MVAGEVRYQPLAVDNPLEQNVQFYIASGPPFVSIDSPTYGIRTRISPRFRISAHGRSRWV